MSSPDTGQGATGPTAQWSCCLSTEPFEKYAERKHSPVNEARELVLNIIDSGRFRPALIMGLSVTHSTVAERSASGLIGVVTDT